jgi:uncharacterized protein (TIGR00251 family)
MPNWYRRVENTIFLTLHIQPGAKHSEIFGLHGTALKIRLAAPPTEGRANKALLRFTADKMDVSLRQVSLERGTKSRSKVVTITDSAVDPESLLLIKPKK